MSTSRRSRPLYYGWIVTAATGSIGFANAATAISILTIFVVPISEEFGWGRAEIAGATTLGAILGASLAPFVGRLVDRFGSRIILVVGGTIIGLACIYLSVMQTLIGFYLAFTTARVADQGGVKIGTSVTTGKWFQRYRGRATGLVFFVETIGVITLAPLTHLVISQWGWRPAWLTLAGLMFLLGVLPCALWVRRQPEDMGLEVDGGRGPENAGRGGPSSSSGAVPHESSFTLKEAARTWGYWMAVTSLFIGSIATSGVGLHLVPYLTEQGISAAAAVTAISVMATSGAAGALLAGAAGDRLSPRWVIVALNLVGAAALGLLVGTDTLPETYAFVVLLGLASTGINTLAPIMWARYYGRQSLGSIQGVGRAAQVMGFAIGPLASGIAHDATGSYRAAFIVMTGLALLAAALMAASRTRVSAATTSEPAD